jgi:hypothetical protein
MDESQSDLTEQIISNNNPIEKDDSEPIVIITSSTNANSKMAHQQIHSPNEALKDVVSLEVFKYLFFINL